MALQEVFSSQLSSLSLSVGRAIGIHTYEIQLGNKSLTSTAYLTALIYKMNRFMLLLCALH